ncbi:hypothetical protein EDD16DRAFT_1730396 [Pisolithus croceorrhizus]|nr:hypothetical protein EDD16DRAFT_1730396 [Pisolithus croceorrhizus]KAI6159419.1 hypothetical protein EDD17DRAFT_1838985 [Pisolithus thermaeus]
MTRGLACTKLTSNVEHFGTTALRKWIRHRILSSSIWHMVQYLVIAPSTMRNPSAPWTVAHPPCPKLANSPRPPARFIVAPHDGTLIRILHGSTAAFQRLKSCRSFSTPPLHLRWIWSPQSPIGGHASFQFDCQWPLRTGNTTRLARFRLRHDLRPCRRLWKDGSCFWPGPGSNPPSSSVSDTAPSPHEPRPLAANDPADDVIIHHSSTIARGWNEPDGKTYNDQIDYHCEGHSAAARGIGNMAWGVKVECRRRPLSAKQEVKRKVFIRHLRKAHMTYWHPKREEARTPWRRRRN